ARFLAERGELVIELDRPRRPKRRHSAKSDAAFAMLAHTAPIPASSRMTFRHRLNRSDDHRLNQSIHTVVVTPIRVDTDTKISVERPRTEDTTDREIKRCLERYATRQRFRQLEHHDVT
ncbi:MAG: hypothetical protein RLZZ01_2605, partial [Actinomycetota bacterium]